MVICHLWFRRKKCLQEQRFAEILNLFFKQLQINFKFMVAIYFILGYSI